MKKYRLTYYFGLFLLVAVILTFSTPVCFAFGELRTAKTHLEMGFPNKAYKILDLYIDKHAGNLKAHYLLGWYYMEVGNDTAAHKRFSKVLEKDARYKNNIGKKYYHYAKVAKSNRQVETAKNRFTNALHLLPGLKSQAFDFYRELGVSSTGRTAEGCYDIALRYAQNKAQKITIANAYLRLAASGYNCQACKQKAANIAGNKYVDKIFPKPYTKIVFIGEYTDADISEPNDDGGWVPTFDWAKIRTGSATVIEGKIPPGCKQIFYYRGEQFKPQFLPTINGSKKIPITSRPANGKFMIWIQKGKGIKATVKVIQKINPPPKTELIASIN